MAKHNDFGKQGEEVAANFLIDKGYEILERNWRNIHKEIDIIAKDGNELVIVEVKARQSEEHGEPDLAVTPKKRSLLVSAANSYILKNKVDLNTRFDIISIIFRDGKPIVDHIKDAFLPHW